MKCEDISSLSTASSHRHRQVFSHVIVNGEEFVIMNQQMRVVSKVEKNYGS